MCLLNMNHGRPSVGVCWADAQPQALLSQASCPAVNAALPTDSDTERPLLDHPITLMPVKISGAVCQQVWADTLACSGGLLTVLGSSRSGMVAMPASRRWSLCKINSNDNAFLSESLICDQLDANTWAAASSSRTRNSHNKNSMCMRRIGQQRRAHHTQSWHPQQSDQDPNLGLQLNPVDNGLYNVQRRQLCACQLDNAEMPLQSGDMTAANSVSKLLVIGDSQQPQNQNLYENVRNWTSATGRHTCPQRPDIAPEQHFEEMQISWSPPTSLETPEELSQEETSLPGTQNSLEHGVIYSGITPSTTDILSPYPTSTSESESSWSRGFTGAAQNSRDWETLKATQQKLHICGFYYENMSMDQAISKLQSTPVGTFLLRDSGHNNYLFTLSAKTPRGVTSVRIEYKNSVFRLDCDEEALGKLPSFDCVLKLIQHFVVSSKVRGKSHCVWLENTGRRDTRVLLSRPLVQRVQTLTHLCRKVIHRTASPRALAHQLRTDSPLMQLLQDYPYIVWIYVLCSSNRL